MPTEVDFGALACRYTDRYSDNVTVAADTKYQDAVAAAGTAAVVRVRKVAMGIDPNFAKGAEDPTVNRPLSHLASASRRVRRRVSHIYSWLRRAAEEHADFLLPLNLWNNLTAEQVDHAFAVRGRPVSAVAVGFDAGRDVVAIHKLAGAILCACYKTSARLEGRRGRFGESVAVAESAGRMLRQRVYWMSLVGNGLFGAITTEARTYFLDGFANIFGTLPPYESLATELGRVSDEQRLNFMDWALGMARRAFFEKSFAEEVVAATPI